MDLGLKRKKALVTGGSKGIGLACAQALAAEGADVVIVARDRGRIDRALAEIPRAVGEAADLSDAAEAAAALERIERRLGPLDILVNSAGAAKRTAPDELTPAHWRAAMDAKYFTYINMIDPTIKRMAARRAGVIVNIVGIGGKSASPTHLAGGAANAALMLATVGLAAAYASRGVRVVGVNPGHTLTERVREGLEVEAGLDKSSLEDALAKLVARVPIGRLADPKDVAEFVAFLASDRASYVTGVNVTMDGAVGAVVI